MPLSNNDLSKVQCRVLHMLKDTIKTFETIEKNSQTLYRDRAKAVQAAINECLDDFFRNTKVSGENDPETILKDVQPDKFQRAGLYGSQLAIKESQVLEANKKLRDRLTGSSRKPWRKPFKKWIDVINNFLFSLISATGLGEALKELKGCLRDELPDY